LASTLRLNFDSFDDALLNAFNIQTGTTLYVWRDTVNHRWVLSDWNSKDEEAAKGVFIAVRPSSSLDVAWLHNQDYAQLKAAEERLIDLRT